MRITDFHPFAKAKEWWIGFSLRRREGPKRPFVLERMAAIFQEKTIPYRLIYHPDVFTASKLAASIHKPGKEVAKVVIVRAEGKYLMAVLPAHMMLDLNLFSGMIGEVRLSLAKERELKKLFPPDCEVGAMPPFGNLYDMPVFVDSILAANTTIFFPAGSHHETLELHFADFERLVRPMVGHFAVSPLKKVVAA